ncbi:MAG: DUF2510 domain-containing protein [Acidimicrobiia bacterium]|nr:DUF2510 domain-containing protein [Acidimicrobiia bacterium]
MSEADQDPAGLPEPGWYHDPVTDGHQRYWDGTTWVGSSVPIQAAPGPPARYPAGPQPLPPGAGRPPAPPPPEPMGRDRSPRRPGGGDIAIIFGVLGLLLVGGCGVVLAGVGLRAGGSGQAEFVEVEEAVVVAAEEEFFITTTGPPMPTRDLVPSTTVGPGPGGDPRSSAVVVNYGSPMTVPLEGIADGTFTVWDVVVAGPADISADVAAANPLDAEPVPGVSWIAVMVELTLLDAGVEPVVIDNLTDWLNLEFEGGATAARYAPDPVGVEDNPFGCTAAVDPLPATVEVGVGDTIAGHVCLRVPEADIGHAGSRITIWPDGAPPAAWGS